MLVAGAWVRNRQLNCPRELDSGTCASFALDLQLMGDQLCG